MRVEFRLWHKPSPDTSYQPLSLHTTTQDAANAAGTHLFAWRALRNGDLAISTATGRWMISPEKVPEAIQDRIDLAVSVALEDGQTDGADHKMWVIDQMLRHLLGDSYGRTVGYDWDGGTPP